MHKFYLALLTLCCIGNQCFSQSILEQFEDEADNATTFTTHGIQFTLTGQLHVESFATLGVGPSLKYVDVSNFCPSSNAVGTQGTVYTTNKQNIIIDTIYVFPSIDCINHNTSGTLVLNGYSGGTLVATNTVSSFTAPVYGTWLNGFTKLTQPFSTTSVDSIAFVTTGSLKYVAFDQIVFRKRDITWTGTNNTSWNTSGNWDDNVIPGTRDNIVIPGSLTNYPNITSGTVSCRNITINSGGSVTVNGGTLQISGSITNNGTFTSTNGSVVLNDAGVSGYASLITQTPSTVGPSAQSIPSGAFAGNTIANLTLNNSAGATLAGTLNITGTYTPTSGTLTTGGFLTLKSTAGGTARIAAGGTGGGYISGNVNTERYIPGGRRAFRFFSHPFTSSQSLSILTDDIDITGSGGATNGFTTTGSNNPSSYWYDVSTANGSSSNDPGWTAFTSASTNSWDQYEGIRVLVRGAKTEGLTSGAYTPSAVTLDMSGAVNQGTQSISVTKGSGTTYALVGNPFPSPVSMDATSKTAGIGSNFYIWSAQQGTKGGYTTYTYGSSSFNLPACGAFVTQISSNGTITIEEADKTGSTSTMFKTTSFPNRVTLNLEDSTIFWDRLQLHYNDNNMAVAETDDALKFPNPEITFSTYSKDDSALAIDNRPYAENEPIILGFNTPYQKNYKIVASEFDIPAGTKLYMKDNYTGKNEEITLGYEYWFTVDANATSQGKGRFELNAVGQPTNGIAVVAKESKLKVKLVPNPVTSNVTVYYEGTGQETLITVTNMMGAKLSEVKADTKNGNVVIPMSHLSNGIYIVNIRSGQEIVTQKLIKQ